LEYHKDRFVEGVPKIIITCSIDREEFRSRPKSEAELAATMQASSEYDDAEDVSYLYEYLESDHSDNGILDLGNDDSSGM